MLHVVVRDADGELMEFVMKPYDLVSDLKAKIAGVCRVPPLCQELSVKGTALHNPWEELIARTEHGSSELPVFLEISVDTAMKEIAHEAPERRANALNALAELGLTGSERAVSALCTRLAHSDREAALKALTTMVNRGHAHAVKALAALSEDDHAEVRRAAVEAMAQVAQGRNEVARRLEDADRDVRLAAVRAMVEVGDTQAIVLLGQRLDDRSVCIRREALESLVQLGGRGQVEQELAFAEVSARLQHADADVRCLALRGLPQLAPRGDPGAIDGACARLADAEPNVRRAALDVLGLVAERGDARVVGFACVHLQSEAVEARVAAAQALAQMAQPGDDSAVAALAVSAGDSNVDVRVAVLHALSLVGDARAVTVALQRFRDPAPHVRRMALQVVAALAERGDKEVASAVEELLDDGNPDVFRLAAEVLGRLGGVPA